MTISFVWERQVVTMKTFAQTAFSCCLNWIKKDRLNSHKTHPARTRTCIDEIVSIISLASLVTKWPGWRLFDASKWFMTVTSLTVYTRPKWKKRCSKKHDKLNNKNNKNERLSARFILVIDSINIRQGKSLTRRSEFHFGCETERQDKFVTLYQWIVSFTFALFNPIERSSCLGFSLRNVYFFCDFSPSTKWFSKLQIVHFIEIAKNVFTADVANSVILFSFFLLAVFIGR